MQRVLEEAIADSGRLRAHLEFNRFEVTVERADNKVVLADVLDATAAGSQIVPIPEFVHALSRRSA